MKITDEIYLENQNLQKIIGYISNGLYPKHKNVEYLISDFIVNDPHNLIGKCPYAIKLILDKFRTLILTNQSNELAFQYLIKDWDKFFQYNLNICEQYKKDFEKINTLVENGELIYRYFS